MPICGSCATDNPPQARFCLACGAPLVPTVEEGQIRRLATVVICDLVGSTEFGDRLDPEALRMVMHGYYAAMRSAIERHGGIVEKFIGDAVVGVFGLPLTHEDDALRALRAAFDMRDAVPDLNRSLDAFGVVIAVRIGIQSGEIVSDEHATTVGAVAGDAFNIAARLQAAASAGEVVVGETTAHLLAGRAELTPLPPLDIPGKDAAVSAYRATALAATPAGVGRAALVGRSRALSTLRRALDEAVEDGSCVLVTVLGQPGIGKSRLWAEFGRSLDDEATVLVGQVLPYGDGATFAPVVELVRMACGGPRTPAAEIPHRLRTLLGGAADGEAVAEHLLALLGLDAAPGGSETSWALRRLFERLATRRPVVVVIDDLHWAEQILLDLLDLLADQIRAPAVLICLARPELLEIRPTWGGGKPRAVAMTLEPLAAGPAGELATALLGAGTAPDVIDRVIRSAEGNPLYLEQLAAMVNEGLPGGDPGALPLGIQSLLAARLDRLEPEDAAALSTAAVQGREFTSAMLGALAPRAQGSTVLDRLESLEARGFVRRLDDLGERWAFVHGLLRDAAERRLAKLQRAELHELLAGELDQGPDRDDELIGLHLERATRLRQELAMRDGRTSELATRAGLHLARAGGVAFARIDLQMAASLLGRAAALLPETAPARLDLVPDLGVALTEVGRPEEAAALLAETIEVAGDAGDEVQGLRAAIQLWSTRLYLGDMSLDDVEAAAREAIASLEAHGDVVGLAQAWVLIEYIDQMRGAYTRGTASALIAVDYARRSGRLREQLQASGDIPSYLVWGLGDARAIAAAHDVMAAGDDPISFVTVDALNAVEAARRGDEPGFRAADARRRSRLDERGLSWLEATHTSTFGGILLQLGAADEASERLRDAHASLIQYGDIWWAAAVEPLVALALDQSGRSDEFLAVVDRGPAGGAPDDRPTKLSWLIVESRAHLARGRLDQAVRTGQEAVAGWKQTDVALLHAMAHESLATVLDMAGRPDEASAARAAALRIYVEHSFQPGIARLASGQI